MCLSLKDYGSWSLADLKSELRKRNAKVSGKKAVLAKRLKDYDNLFGPIINEPDTSYHILLPSHEDFRDINGETQLPTLCLQDLDTYCVLTERKNKETSQQMYEEGFLLTIRSVTHQSCYITATTASEMRKSISYTVNVVYEENIIKEAQCECAAGQGPYAQCKHVLVVLFAVIDFSNTKTVKIRPSPTSALQTFHQPHRFYSGQPVKAQDLVIKVNNMAKIPNWDPRPSTSKNNKEKYKEDFEKSLKNYTCTKKVHLPISELYEPANKKALYDDHDYLHKHVTEYYIESLKLNEEELKDLEVKTRNDKDLWKLERLKRLQSSNYGKICKSKDQSKKKLAISLLKSIDISCPAIKHGIKMEPKAIEEFTKITGLEAMSCGIIVHPIHQYLATVPDGLIGNDATLEIKCPYSAFEKTISPETVPYLYLCDKTGGLMLDASHNYYYQVQGQLMCTNRQKTFFCVYTGTDILIIEIFRDTSFIDKMFHNLKEFYCNYYKELFLKRYLLNEKI